jgi:hypothetical protein
MGLLDILNNLQSGPRAERTSGRRWRNARSGPFGGTCINGDFPSAFESHS